MSGPNPNRQPVELNRTSLFWGLLSVLIGENNILKAVKKLHTIFELD